MFGKNNSYEIKSDEYFILSTFLIIFFCSCVTFNFRKKPCKKNHIFLSKEFKLGDILEVLNCGTFTILLNSLFSHNHHFIHLKFVNSFEFYTC
jgi:hypothetical protein